ncbi:hypothetical protein IWQ61_007898 [Dispira simplex]|nr:hypothetical protein IWQ61_007898 [Dispira simplex]
MTDSTYRIDLVRGVKGGFLPPPNHIKRVVDRQEQPTQSGELDSTAWKNVLESLGHLEELRNFTQNEPLSHDWLGKDTILMVNTPDLVWNNAFGSGCTVDPFPEDNTDFVAATDAHKTQFTKVTDAILQAVSDDSQCTVN